MRLWAKRILAGIVLIAAVTNAGARASGAPIVVKIGINGRPDDAPMVLALGRGYFAQQGLDIQTVLAGAGSDFVAPLAANQIQVTTGSLNAGLFNAINRGINIRFVADYAHVGDAHDADVSIVVRSELLDSGAVKTISDLKGRSINFGAGLGTYGDVLIGKVLRKGGLASTDVTQVRMGFADSMAAMANGKLDAGFMIEPLVTQGEQQKIFKVLVRSGEVDSGAELSVLQYSQEFAKQKDAATKFMIAYLHGVRDYYDAFYLKHDQDAAIAILTRDLPIKDPTVWKNASRHSIDLNGRLNIADMKRQVATLKDLGYISGPLPDMDKLVDPSIAEAAVKVAGVRRGTTNITPTSK